MQYLLVLSIVFLTSMQLEAGEIKDATGRTVVVPDRVERVMAAGPNAAVVLYVLAPDKMVGWPSAPRPNEREFIVPAARERYRRVIVTLITAPAEVLRARLATRDRMSDVDLAERLSRAPQFGHELRPDHVIANAGAIERAAADLIAVISNRA